MQPDISGPASRIVRFSRARYNGVARESVAKTSLREPLKRAGAVSIRTYPARVFSTGCADF